VADGATHFSVWDIFPEGSHLSERLQQLVVTTADNLVITDAAASESGEVVKLGPGLEDQEASGRSHRGSETEGHYGQYSRIRYRYDKREFVGSDCQTAKEEDSEETKDKTLLETIVC
jgi:hypothetical protein